MSVPKLLPGLPVISQHVQNVRGSGLTTAQALAVLATAVANPGAYVTLADHHGTSAADDGLGRTVKYMRTALALDVAVERGDDGRLYAISKAKGATEAKYVSR